MNYLVPKGTGNIEYLAQNNVHKWDEWPYKAYLKKNLPVPESSSEWKNGIKEFIQKIAEDHDFAEKWGDLGPVYGVQWRKWPDGTGGHIDQIEMLSKELKNHPIHVAMIVSAWK